MLLTKINILHLKRSLFVLIGCLAAIYAMGTTPLSLDSCLRIAQENNRQIRQSAIDIDKANDVKNQVITKYFPQISASAIGYHSLHPIIEIGIDDIRNATVRDLLSTLYSNYGEALGLENTLSLFEYGFQVGVTALQPIYMGGKVITGHQLAKVGVEAAQLQADMTTRNVLQEVEESYWMVVGLTDKQQTLSAGIALIDTIYQTVQTAVNAGLALSTDLMQVTLKQSEMQRTQIQLTHGMQLAKRALCLSMGIPYNDSVSVVSTLSLTTDSIAQLNVAQTPEHRLLQLQIQAAELEKRMAIADALPHIAIGAHYGYSYLQANILRDGLSNTYGNGTLFLSVTVPLSAWWETGYKIKQQDRQLEQARLQQEYNNELLYMRTQQAYNQMKEASLLIIEHEKALQIATQHFQLTQANYQAGMTTITQLLEAQTTLFQTQNNLTDAYISYRIAQRKYQNYQ